MGAHVPCSDDVIGSCGDWDRGGEQRLKRTLGKNSISLKRKERGALIPTRRERKNMMERR